MNIAQASALYLTLFVFGAVGYVAHDHYTAPQKACIQAGHTVIFMKPLDLEQAKKTFENITSWCRGGPILHQ